ncbi:hypothetical protein HDV00_004377 [Rhizophlyctis rosea]|nr:hypothetical protein HDV00_004377 [Rhizophlyctis rosea]
MHDSPATSTSPEPEASRKHVNTPSPEPETSRKHVDTSPKDTVHFEFQPRGIADNPNMAPLIAPTAEEAEAKRRKSVEKGKTPFFGEIIEPVKSPFETEQTSKADAEEQTSKADAGAETSKTDAGDILTELDEVPVTKERSVRFAEGLEMIGLSNPGLPRVNVAVDAQHPEDPQGMDERMTVLQRHCKFFCDYIYPWDTLLGFKAIGFGWIISLFAMVVIHAAFSWITQDCWFLNPYLLTGRIDIKNIDRGKHGSDTGVYDTEGRFVPERFEEKSGMYGKDLFHMIRGNMVILDLFGWSATSLEWLALWLLCHDENGFLDKEILRGVYDGTLFDQMEARNTHKGLAVRFFRSKAKSTTGGQLLITAGATEGDGGDSDETTTSGSSDTHTCEECARAAIEMVLERDAREAEEKFSTDKLKPFTLTTTGDDAAEQAVQYMSTQLHADVDDAGGPSEPAIKIEPKAAPDGLFEDA